MTWLVLGLLIFLGAHSLRMIAPRWRQRRIEQWGAHGWRALFATVSVIGFVLIVVGFGDARETSQLLYAPPAFGRHLNGLLTLTAFVLVAATYVPRNHLKAVIGHPMLAGTALWALAHLMTAGMLRDVVLFGGFAVWAALDFIASRRRDRIADAHPPTGTVAGDVLIVVIGAVAWAIFAAWLHAPLIGVDVSPL